MYEIVYKHVDFCFSKATKIIFRPHVKYFVAIYPSDKKQESNFSYVCEKYLGIHDLKFMQSVVN